MRLKHLLLVVDLGGCVSVSRIGVQLHAIESLVSTVFLASWLHILIWLSIDICHQNVGPFLLKHCARGLFDCDVASVRSKQGIRLSTLLDFFILQSTFGLTSSKWVSIWMRVRAFSRKTMSMPEGMRYSLNLLSCMLASCAKTNDECSKPKSSPKQYLIRVSTSKLWNESLLQWFLTCKQWQKS